MPSRTLPSAMCLFAVLIPASLNGSPSSQDGEAVAQTPIMGWSSWNYFTCKVSDAIIREQTDALVSTGMAAAGYRYVMIDDCWQGERDKEGVIHPNSKFPDMKALVNYVHGKGLKIGIYSSPGPKTCAGFLGSFNHEQQDAQTYAEWGFDWLKYDRCSFEGDPAAEIAAYQKMHDCLKRAGRPMAYAICQYGTNRVWTWGAAVGGNQWRTSSDISDNYLSMSNNGFNENGLEPFGGPGHWNDPDMMEIGNGGMTGDEYRTHMSLWCILAAPLLAGNDLTHMNSQTLALLTNPEVIAIDQDPAGIQGRRVAQEGPLEVWAKPLADGGQAVGLFNRTGSVVPVTVDFNVLGLQDPVLVRDLWQRKDLGTFQKKFTAGVPGHGVVLVTAKKQ